MSKVSVIAATASAVAMSGIKQPGRRFGPPVRAAWPFQAAGHPGHATPLTNDAREANYRSQTGRLRRQITSRMDAATSPKAYEHVMGLTPRQRRRSWHKELSAARVIAARELAKKEQA